MSTTPSMGAGARRPRSPRPLDHRLRLPPEQRLRVNEIYYSLQGESTFAGQPCVLVRLTGCQMRCHWCDSEHSFYEGVWRTIDEIIQEIVQLKCSLVEITGGEPLLQPGCQTLMRRLCNAGYEVLLETGGGVDISTVDRRVHRVVDVKCPGSGEAENNLWSNLEFLSSRDEVKFVLSGEADYRWATRIVNKHRLGERCPVHFSPVAKTLEPERLAAWILRDRLPVRLQLQLHKVLWGPERRGV